MRGTAETAGGWEWKREEPDKFDWSTMPAQLRIITLKTSNPLLN